MIKEITMPAGGQTTDTSTVGTWLVKKGDKVKRGDALLEIETDKATLTVESYAKGTVLEILVKEGDVVPAGQVIAYIGEEGETPEIVSKAKKGNAELFEAEDEYQPIDKTSMTLCDKPEVQAMPNAKVMAKENVLSLEEVAEYTGKSLLKRQDIKDYLDNVDKGNVSTEEEKQDIKIPLTTMRTIIGRRMLESTQSIPAFQVTVEADMTQCIILRTNANSGSADRKISYNDIIFKCVEAAIRKFPYINASLGEGEIILHQDVNIGLAVAVESGLVVPVVRKVQQKNIGEISLINQANVSKAREGKLTTEEMTGGTITVSNLGMYPVTQFSAIINPPEVCILAFAAIEKVPVVREGNIEIIPVMKITGSFDHRGVDGAYGAQFLAELKKIIETPAMALV